MLSPSSLAAFSAGIQVLQPLPAQRVRAPGTAPAVGAAPSPGSSPTMPPRAGDSANPPTRLLPRGSLLDLSV